MTREEAIKWLKMESSKPIKWDDYSEESKQIREDAERHIAKAFDMAIDALKAHEPVKPLKMAVDHVRKEPVVFSYECPVCMCGLRRHWVACPICGTGVKFE